MPRRGRPCGPVWMLELATVPRALFIRPNASSPGYPALPVATSHALLCRHFECLVENRVSAALSFMLLLIRRCRCRNFHSSYTVLIAPRTRLHRVHLISSNSSRPWIPSSSHKRGIPISRKSQTYLARLGIGLSRVPLLGLLGVVRDRPGALAELLGLNLRRHFELMEGLVVKARRKEKRKVVLSSSSS